MPDLSPQAQAIVDALKKEHPMLTDRTAGIFASAVLCALVNTSSVSYFFANGEEHIVNSRLILNLAKEVEQI